MGIDFEAWKKQVNEKGNRQTQGRLSEGGLEQCEYCDMSYHPMARWTRGDDIIFVCDMRIGGGKVQAHGGCKAKALAAGFTFRRDLTPSR